MKISVKRVYDDPSSQDGLRILVDRLWPRGLWKENAKVHVWLKTVAPSNELRKWYQHEAGKWPEFRKRYFAELDREKDAVDELLGYLKKGHATFLYAAKEPDYNNAVALRDYINSKRR